MQQLDMSAINIEYFMAAKAAGMLNAMMKNQLNHNVQCVTAKAEQNNNTKAKNLFRLRSTTTQYNLSVSKQGPFDWHHRLRA